jgi:hypothetical protein
MWKVNIWQGELKSKYTYLLINHDDAPLVDCMYKMLYASYLCAQLSIYAILQSI